MTTPKKYTLGIPRQILDQGIEALEKHPGRMSRADGLDIANAKAECRRARMSSNETISLTQKECSQLISALIREGCQINEEPSWKAVQFAWDLALKIERDKMLPSRFTDM